MAKKTNNDQRSLRQGKAGSAKKKIAAVIPQSPTQEKDSMFHTEDFVVNLTRTNSSEATLLSHLFPVKILRKDSKKGFRFLDGVNRAVIPSHVTKMAESVSRIGITRPVIVSYFEYKGTKDYYIIDGQNLYHALLRLNFDIPYKTIEVDSEEDMVEKIALLNTSSKSWTLMDYVTAWSYIRPDYKKLGHFFNVYDLELSCIASLMYGYAGTSSTNITKVIKEGKFQVKDLNKSIEILDFTTEVLSIVPRFDRNANRIFVSSYTGFVVNNYDQYDHVRFTKYIKRNLEKLQLVNADKERIAEFISKAF